MNTSAFKHNLETLFTELNDFISQKVDQAREDRVAIPAKQVIKIVGQTALLLSNLPFPVTATMDLDVISKLDYSVFKKLEELLLDQGIRLETDGHLIWMPKETHYQKIFDYPWVEVWIADAESVIASKYKFKREKDKKLIQTYLQYFPDQKDRIQKKAKA